MCLCSSFAVYKAVSWLSSVEIRIASLCARTRHQESASGGGNAATTGPQPIQEPTPQPTDTKTESKVAKQVRLERERADKKRQREEAAEEKRKEKEAKKEAIRKEKIAPGVNAESMREEEEAAKQLIAEASTQLRRYNIIIVRANIPMNGVACDLKEWRFAKDTRCS